MSESVPTPPTDISKPPWEPPEFPMPPVEKVNTWKPPSIPETPIPGSAGAAQPPPTEPSPQLTKLEKTLTDMIENLTDRIEALEAKATPPRREA